MEQILESILTMYFAGEFELTNLLISQQPEIKNALVQYVAEKYGWAEPFLYVVNPDSPHTRWITKQSNLGTPCDWLFGTHLQAYGKGLTKLGELPPTLIYMDCRSNSLTSLPALPPKLQVLMCSENDIRKLPELPDTLETLMCQENQLKTLPKRPASLRNAWIDSNPLNKTRLPKGWKLV